MTVPMTRSGMLTRIRASTSMSTSTRRSPTCPALSATTGNWSVGSRMRSSPIRTTLRSSRSTTAISRSTVIRITVNPTGSRRRARSRCTPDGATSWSVPTASMSFTTYQKEAPVTLRPTPATMSTWRRRSRPVHANLQNRTTTSSAIGKCSTGTEALMCLPV